MKEGRKLVAFQRKRPDALISVGNEMPIVTCPLSRFCSKTHVAGYNYLVSAASLREMRDVRPRESGSGQSQGKGISGPGDSAEPGINLSTYLISEDGLAERVLQGVGGITEGYGRRVERRRKPVPCAVSPRHSADRKQSASLLMALLA